MGTEGYILVGILVFVLIVLVCFVFLVRALVVLFQIPTSVGSFDLADL